jgi:hypothetical protein
LTRRAAIAAAGSLTRAARAQVVPPAARAQAVQPHPAIQHGPPPVVIGVLTGRSGIGASVSGPPLVQPVRMAVEDTGLLPDRRPLSVVTGSFLLKPDDGLAIGRRWFDQGCR